MQRAARAGRSATAPESCTDWPVAGVARDGTGYRLAHRRRPRRSTPNGSSSTAGGWLPALLDRLPLPAGFRALAAAAAGQPGERLPLPLPGGGGVSAWPTFIHKSSAIPTYGLPGGRDAGFRGQKIAEFLGGRRIASAADQDGRRRPGEPRPDRRLRPAVPARAWFPSPTPRRPACSPARPTEDFVVDGVDGITLVSPCSGPRRQVRAADRRHRRRRGHRRGTRPRPVHRPGPLGGGEPWLTPDTRPSPRRPMGRGGDLP